MQKFLATGLIIILLALIVGSFAIPNAPIMWFASTTTTYTIMRFMLIAALIILIFTEPPRSHSIRAGLGGMSITLALWTLAEIYSNHLHMWDFMAFLLAAVILALESLEREPNPDVLPRHAKAM